MSIQWIQQSSRYVFSVVFGYLEKSNTWMNAKRLGINRLQKTIEYKTNEESTKHSNWSMEIQSDGIFVNINR